MNGAYGDVVCSSTKHAHEGIRTLEVASNMIPLVAPLRISPQPDSHVIKPSRGGFCRVVKGCGSLSPRDGRVPAKSGPAVPSREEPRGLRSGKLP